MFNITLYILCDMYNVFKLNVYKCKRECCNPFTFTHPPPHDMIESRSDAHPYLPVIRVAVGVLELVVVVAAVLAMFCVRFGLRVGGTRLILAVNCGDD